MCNRYRPPRKEAICAHWQVDGNTVGAWPVEVHPRQLGPFVRIGADGRRELTGGQWALIPDFAKSQVLRYQTNNARSEELAEKASFRGPWKRGQRCIIPALSFDEPNWESGRNVWWRFERADAKPWGLAGLWNTWLDRATGELMESYTMLTINADSHPLLRRMHKPKSDRSSDAQDKRAVIPIADTDVEAWLYGSYEEAARLLTLPCAEVFWAGPSHDLSAGAENLELPLN